MKESLNSKSKKQKIEMVDSNNFIGVIALDKLEFIKKFPSLENYEKALVPYLNDLSCVANNEVYCTKVDFVNTDFAKTDLQVSNLEILPIGYMNN